MKKILIISSVMLMAMSTLWSCKEDEPTAKPVITLTELGLENSKSVALGGNLHIEADVVAEAKIKTIQVIVHHHEHTTEKQYKVEEEWSYDSTYTEFAGLKNAEFHKHIEIPSTAEAGEYHFDFIVVDNDGNSTSVESDLEITAAQ